MTTNRTPWDPASDTVDGSGRFVTRAEWSEYYRDHLEPPALIDAVVAEALARAADDVGELLNFDAPDFFDQHVAPLLDERGAAGTATYDMFTAMALTESLHRLMFGGLLAHRGNGDSYDYRLALPNEGQDDGR